MFLLRTATLFLSACFVSAAALLAQPSTGRITGVVRDATSAGVPGVTVTVVNQDTRARISRG
jgi:hypothetical protein